MQKTLRLLDQCNDTKKLVADKIDEILESGFKALEEMTEPKTDKPVNT